MASGSEAESSQNDEGLAELVRRIQIGDQTAIQAFRSMFLPGIEFLLRRKLERSTVTAEAARVLTAAVQEIEATSPAQAINPSQLVTRTIHRLFPSASRSVESHAEDTPMESWANSVLAERTPVEQDILRRYYVLGESPEEIRIHLRVSSRTIERTIASARADFRGKMQRSESA
jgi:DNA-directed RNA polymerase specialized sigma24 family protein